VRSFVDGIRALYTPEDTAVITEIGNPRSYAWLRHAMFYLAEYPIYQLSVNGAPPRVYAPRVATTILSARQSEIRVPRGVRRLIWFVDHWNPALTRPPGLREIELPYGRYLYVLPIGRRPVSYAGFTLIREDAGRARR
jgi:hypothetical protein